MNRTVENPRVLFRLDFALRGHAAYTQPLSLERLVELVEQTRARLGGPLLPSNEVNSESNEERVLMAPREAAGTVIECKSRFAIREEAV